jgi:hypothetical protein
MASDYPCGIFKLWVIVLSVLVLFTPLITSVVSCLSLFNVRSLITPVVSCLSLFDLRPLITPVVSCLSLFDVRSLITPVVSCLGVVRDRTSNKDRQDNK